MAQIAARLASQKIVYLDVNTSFGASNNSVLLTNIDAINNQISNVFGTDIGEADYEPFLGTSLANRLFDPNAKPTHESIQTDLWYALNRWLGDRIDVSPNNILVTPKMDDRQVFVKVKYFYRQFGVTVETTMVFDFSGVK